MRLFTHCPRVAFRSKSAQCDSYTIFLSGSGPIFGQNHARPASTYSQRTLFLSIARPASAPPAPPTLLPTLLPPPGPTTFPRPPTPPPPPPPPLLPPALFHKQLPP